MPKHSINNIFKGVNMRKCVARFRRRETCDGETLFSKFAGDTTKDTTEPYIFIEHNGMETVRQACLPTTDENIIKEHISELLERADNTPLNECGIGWRNADGYSVVNVCLNNGIAMASTDDQFVRTIMGFMQIE